MSLQRLDKIIASMGQHSRKDVKNLIKARKISVNGAIVSSSDIKCDPKSDEIIVDGIRLNYSEHIYIMLNKPAGVLSATTDAHDRTVLDLIPSEYRKPDMFPVGRLDKDTEGLLLLTDDGVLAHELLSPRKHVDKTYFVRLEGCLNEDHVKAFADGVTLADGYECMGAKLEILNSDEALITIREGKFHQIKRMFGTINMPVLYLKRLTMGALSLDENLEPGQFRMLTSNEIELLQKS